MDVAPVDQDWVAKWRKYSDRAAKVVSEISNWSEQLIAREIGFGIASGTTLYISSSRPIRDIEGFASARGGIETFANRGLAGIDGNISTALGIAANRSQTIAVLGDLSFLHDLTGLVNKEEINLKIYVINNDGGGIFSTLPARGSKGFEKIFGTPHGLDLSAIAGALGIYTKTISNQSELIADLSIPVKGISVVVIDVPDRDTSAESLQNIYAKMDSL